MKQTNLNHESKVVMLSEHPKLKQKRSVDSLSVNLANRSLRLVLSEAYARGVRGFIDDWVESNLRWGCTLAISAFYDEGLTKRQWLDRVGTLANLVAERYAAVTPLSEDQYDALMPYTVAMMIDCYAECCRIGVFKVHATYE